LVTFQVWTLFLFEFSVNFVSMVIGSSKKTEIHRNCFRRIRNNGEISDTKIDCDYLAQTGRFVISCVYSVFQM
jgi:hypothetical protein